MSSSEQELLNFCSNIRALRVSHNLSKTQMAKALGIGVRSLNKLEQGNIPPRMNCNVLWRIWRHFGILPGTLFRPK